MATHRPYFGDFAPVCFSPSPSLLQYKCGHLMLQSDLNIAEGKQSAWVPQRVLARTVVYLALLSARIYGNSNRGCIVSRPLAIMMLCYSLRLIEVYPFWSSFCHCSVLKTAIELKRVQFSKYHACVEPAAF